jgi:hypothetical protein
LPVPKGVGGYGRAAQPILSRKRTLVRRQIQNDDRNRKHWGILEGSEVRIDSGEFNEMARQAPPEGRDRARDEEET